MAALRTGALNGQYPLLWFPAAFYEQLESSCVRLSDLCRGSRPSSDHVPPPEPLEPRLQVPAMAAVSMVRGHGTGACGHIRSWHCHQPLQTPPPRATHAAAARNPCHGSQRCCQLGSIPSSLQPLSALASSNALVGNSPRARLFSTSSCTGAPASTALGNSLHPSFYDSTVEKYAQVCAFVWVCPQHVRMCKCVCVEVGGMHGYVRAYMRVCGCRCGCAHVWGSMDLWGWVWGCADVRLFDECGVPKPYCSNFLNLFPTPLSDVVQRQQTLLFNDA